MDVWASLLGILSCIFGVGLLIVLLIIKLTKSKVEKKKEVEEIKLSEDIRKFGEKLGDSKEIFNKTGVNASIGKGKELAMDFSKIDIRKVLESAMPNRFQDFPPSDFEDFISQLFKDNGYQVEQTSYSGDFGADLLIEKAEERIAVQVKRYAKDNKVGVKDVNQIIGARDYYKCKKARIITTSSFTKSGKELSLTTQTDAWDWDRLQKYICDTYLDGKDYYKFFKGAFYIKNEDRKFEFEVKKVEYNQEMKKVGLCTLIYANMKNLTNKNISVSLDSD